MKHDPSQVLSDPDFHTLPPIERLKVLYHIDPDYRKLHPRERWKVVNMVPPPAPVPTSASTPTSAPTPIPVVKESTS